MLSTFSQVLLSRLSASIGLVYAALYLAMITTHTRFTLVRGFAIDPAAAPKAFALGEGPGRTSRS